MNVNKFLTMLRAVSTRNENDEVLSAELDGIEISTTDFYYGWHLVPHDDGTLGVTLKAGEGINDNDLELTETTITSVAYLGATAYVTVVDADKWVEEYEFQIFARRALTIVDAQKDFGIDLM